MKFQNITRTKENEGDPRPKKKLCKINTWVQNCPLNKSFLATCLVTGVRCEKAIRLTC